MTHSTAIESRLNRETGHVFGDSKYAKEELVAELTSAMLCQSMGITKDYTRRECCIFEVLVGGIA
jgi:antirestriction protein ArdC